MAILICANGEEHQVQPSGPEGRFTVLELQILFDQLFPFNLFYVHLADGRWMLVDDARSNAINEKATALYHESRNTARAIRGNVVVGTRQEVR
jgi:hypothetical protein